MSSRTLLRLWEFRIPWFLESEFPAVPETPQVLSPDLPDSGVRKLGPIELRVIAGLSDWGRFRVGESPGFEIQIVIACSMWQ